MFALNPVFENLSPSPTLYINETVNRYWQQGEQAFHMGFGESRFDVHPKLQLALSDNAHQKSYLPSQGLAELREAVASYYQSKLSLSFNPEKTIIGPGSKALIYAVQIAMKADLFLPTPSWVSYQPQAELLGLKTHFIKASAADDYRFDLAAFKEQVEASDNPSKLLIINSPNNPSGAMMEEATLKALADYCREQNILVISDEIYFLVSHPGQTHTSIAQYYPEGTIITGGLSKHLSLGGWRLGCALLPDTEFGAELTETINIIASETWSSVASPVQYAALLAYSNDPEVESYISDCSAIHAIRTQFIRERLQEIGVRSCKPQGGFYLTANVDHWRDALKPLGVATSGELAKHLLEKYKIATLPGEGFGIPAAEMSLRLSTSYLDFETGDDAQRLMNLYKSGVSAEEFMSAEHHPNTHLALEAFSNFAASLQE